MVEKKQNHGRLIINIVTLFALVVLIYMVRHDILSTVSNISKVKAWALLLMIPIQALNYDVYARMYRDLFAVLGNRIKYSRMLRVTLELNFVNHVFPSGGVSGFSYFSLLMKSDGVGTGKSTLVQMMRFILLFISFQVLLFLGILLLALDGKANNFLLLVTASMATLLLVGTIAGAFIIGSEKRIHSFFGYITKLINRIIHVVRPKHPETISIAKLERAVGELHQNYLIFKQNPRMLRMPLVYGLLANLTEVATVYVVYIAFGQWVNLGAVIIAYAVANFAGLVSVLPGGVGIYEALMTAVLASAGIPPGVSIPVTIMYRILNITLQTPPGYFLYHRTIRKTNFVS
jgi:putative heme transporter